LVIGIVKLKEFRKLLVITVSSAVHKVKHQICFDLNIFHTVSILPLLQHLQFFYSCRNVSSTKVHMKITLRMSLNVHTFSDEFKCEQII